MEKSIAKTTIGRSERISFKQADIHGLPAKIDTGAYRSSIWATKIKEKDGMLHFTLLGPSSPFYSGIELTTDVYKTIIVENSFGHRERRYSVFLSVEIVGNKINSNFTLANRGMKKYPALIGRKMLRNRFIVDVSIGESTYDEDSDNMDNLD